METAHICLWRLCGCNYRKPITRKGKSVYVDNPQRSDKRYRLIAAKFDAGKSQIRDSWAIRKWDDRAERICKTEKDWMD